MPRRPRLGVETLVARLRHPLLFPHHLQQPAPLLRRLRKVHLLPDARVSVAVARRIFQEHAEIRRGSPGPARIEHQAPSDRDHIGLIVRQDGFGLARLGDLPHRHGRDAGSLPHRVRQRHLVAGFGVCLSDTPPLVVQM